MNNTLLVINSIILIGGAAAAITNILNVFIKGEGFLKKKSSKAIKEQVDSKFNEYSEELSKTRRKEIKQESDDLLKTGFNDCFSELHQIVTNEHTDRQTKIKAIDTYLKHYEQSLYKQI